MRAGAPLERERQVVVDAARQQVLRRAPVKEDVKGAATALVVILVHHHHLERVGLRSELVCEFLARVVDEGRAIEVQQEVGHAVLCA